MEDFEALKQSGSAHERATLMLMERVEQLENETRRALAAVSELEKKANASASARAPAPGSRASRKAGARKAGFPPKPWCSDPNCTGRIYLCDGVYDTCSCMAHARASMPRA
eukprot:scaffold149405_cov25-Prasinocladus_malaysianus.AAC.1